MRTVRVDFCLWIAVIIVAALALLIGGCEPWDRAVREATAAKAAITETRNATTQAAAGVKSTADELIATLEAEAAALPPSDPLRKLVEAKIGTVRDKAAELERGYQEKLAAFDKGLAKADTIIAAANAKTIEDPSIDAATGAVLGGYGLLGLALLRVLVRNRAVAGEATRAVLGLRQTVKGIQQAKKALSADAAAQLKAALSGAQDDETKRLVGAMKVAA